MRTEVIRADYSERDDDSVCRPVASEDRAEGFDRGADGCSGAHSVAYAGRRRRYELHRMITEAEGCAKQSNRRVRFDGQQLSTPAGRSVAPLVVVAVFFFRCNSKNGVAAAGVQSAPIPVAPWPGFSLNRGSFEQTAARSMGAFLRRFFWLTVPIMVALDVCPEVGGPHIRRVQISSRLAGWCTGGLQFPCLVKNKLV